jgi:hypothetical protein
MRAPLFVTGFGRDLGTNGDSFFAPLSRANPFLDFIASGPGEGEGQGGREEEAAGLRLGGRTHRKVADKLGRGANPGPTSSLNVLRPPIPSTPSPRCPVITTTHARAHVRDSEKQRARLPRV